MGLLLEFLVRQVCSLDQQGAGLVLGYMGISLLPGSARAGLEPGFTRVGLIFEPSVMGLGVGSA